MRAKEFLSRYQVDFEPIDIAFDRRARERLAARGLDSVPQVCLGEECVPGGDLGAIAQLLDLNYEPLEMLPPAVLHDRFVFVLDRAARYFRQAPFEGLATKSPDRDRSFRELCRHIALIPAAFLTAYDSGVLDRDLFQERDVPQTLSGEDLAREVEASRRALDAWWRRAGQEDPFDRVIETYWGAHTLHEAFERETWHTAQHTRQVLMFLENLGVAPDRRLTPEDLTGLPLPEGVWD